MGVGDGWEAEGGLNHPPAQRKSRCVQRKSRCVLSKAQKQPQCTCQDKTVVGNSLTPLVALLVRPSGTIHPTVDRHEFTWSDALLQHDLDGIVRWSNQWQLQLNCSKCEALNVSNKRSPLMYAYTISNQPIQ